MIVGLCFTSADRKKNHILQKHILPLKSIATTFY